MGTPRQIWAIPAIHADLDRLMALHDALFDKIRPGDRVIYLGNYTGYGEYARETIDELLMFRRLILSKPGMKPDDIVYLRGKQEDLWQKLYQLPYDLFPVEGLIDLMGNGLSSTLKSYDVCAHDGINAAKEGVLALTRWTNRIRQSLRNHNGHDCFFMNHRRAAYTHEEENFSLLFVNAGIDTAKTLAEQKDGFWEQASLFDDMTQSYAPFDKIVRGYDPAHKGLQVSSFSTTLDAGCGFGGPLIAAQMSTKGNLYEILQA